jgi:exosortase
MNRLIGNYLQRWWIPLVSSLTFFSILAFLIPYSQSLYEVKRTLASLIWSMASFGHASETLASLDFTYCLFVPLIFAYLVWDRWKDIEKAPIRGSNIGFALIIFGVFVYWFGLRAENQYFGYLALQILLGSLIIWFWGWAVFRILLFPWAFFLFTWPVPFLDPIIAFPLRKDMSIMAAHILPIIGIPCLRNGTGLLSPADPLHGLPVGALFSIDIANPCSGIRSLFALMMFSALFGYLFLPRLWQKWLIFLSAFPVAILGNLARVVLLVLGSIWFGSAFAIGTNEQPSSFHEGCGYLVYAVALGAEILLAALLTRKWKSTQSAPDSSHEEDHVS